jgi:hypothetical protein
LVEHVLACADFLAIFVIPREAASVDASSRDMEGREVEAPGLRPFRRDRTVVPALGEAYELSGARTSAGGSPGSK